MNIKISAKLSVIIVLLLCVCAPSHAVVVFIWLFDIRNYKNDEQQQFFCHLGETGSTEDQHEPHDTVLDL